VKIKVFKAKCNEICMAVTMEKEYVKELQKKLGEAERLPEPQKTNEQIRILKEETEKVKSLPEPERIKKLRIIIGICEDLKDASTKRAMKFNELINSLEGSSEDDSKSEIIKLISKSLR